MPLSALSPIATRLKRKQLAVGILSVLAVVIIGVVVNQFIRQPPQEPPSFHRPQSAGIAKPVPCAEVIAPPPPKELPASQGRFCFLALDAVTKERVQDAVISLKLLAKGPETYHHEFEEAAEGQYSGPDINAAGTYVLDVWADGYERINRYLELSRNTSPMTIELIPLSALRVVVKSEDGTPIIGAIVRAVLPTRATFLYVTAEGPHGLQRFGHLLEEQTDRAGEAVFRGVPAGKRYAIEVSAEGKCVVKKDKIELRMGEVCEEEVVLPIGAAIFGYTIDSSGVRAEGFSVECWRETSDSRPRMNSTELEATTQSGVAGEFRIDALSPGFKRIKVSRVSVGHIELFGFELVLKPGESHDCGEIGPLSLSSGGVCIRGTVTDEDGHLIGLADIPIIAHNYPHCSFKGSTDEYGRFYIVGLCPGEVGLAVMPPKERRAADLTGQRLGTQWFKFRLRPGEEKAVAVVLPYLTKEPPQGGMILLRLQYAGNYVTRAAAADFEFYYKNEDEDWFLARVRPSSETDLESDQSVIGLIPEGCYTLLVIGKGQVGQTAGLVVQNGQETNAEIVLEEGPEIRGRVLDKKTGEGIRASVQRVFTGEFPSKRGSVMGMMPIRTESTGAFATSLFMPGESGRLRIWAPGYKIKMVEFSGTESNVGEVLLEPNL